MKIPAIAAFAASSAMALHVPEPTLSEEWVSPSDIPLFVLGEDVTADSLVDDAKPRSLMIQLPMTNLEMLKQIVKDVSDPTATTYGQYLSMDAVNALTAPAPETIKSVEEWLQAEQAQRPECIIDYNTILDGATVEVRTSTKCVADIFHTSFRTIVNPETNQHHTRASGYTIPARVENDIAFVTGMHSLPLPPRKRTFGPAAAVDVTPQVLSDLYRVSGVTPSGNLNNRQAVVEFQGQYYLPRDLTRYFNKYVSGYASGYDKVYKVVGENKPDAEAEASLDIQVIMGLAPGLKTEFWGFEQGGFCDSVLNMTNVILSNQDVPNVFSFSYGWQGVLTQVCPDASSTVPQIDANLAKIAARGISILVSSGDSGAGFERGGQLFPSWPASSPYVTAVGGTTFLRRGERDSGEMATTQFGSGGGFSSDFDRSNAEWQEQDVVNYLSGVTNVPTSAYSANGRGTPDISALGENYGIFIGGREASIGGTSASAPAVAAIISLLNEYRIQNGKPALGLLNQLIYQNKQAFTSVNVGTNAISRQGRSYRYGWNCTQGWDAATGLGTPLFDQLLQAIA